MGSFGAGSFATGQGARGKLLAWENSWGLPIWLWSPCFCTCQNKEHAGVETGEREVNTVGKTSNTSGRASPMLRVLCKCWHWPGKQRSITASLEDSDALLHPKFGPLLISPISLAEMIHCFICRFLFRIMPPDVSGMGP